MILNTQFKEIISQTNSLNDENFNKSDIKFIIQQSGRAAFNPFRSFFKMRVNLSKANGNILTRSDQIAPNYLLGNSLFQQITIKCNNKIIEQINDYLPQISALHERIFNNSETRKNFLQDLNFSSPYHYDRQNFVVAESNRSKIVQEYKPGNQLSTISYNYAPIQLTINLLNQNGLSTISAATTIQIVAANQRAIFTNVLGNADISNIYRIGDIVEYIHANGDARTFKINSFFDQLTANIVTDDLLINSAATAIGANHVVYRYDKDTLINRTLIGVNTTFLTDLSAFDKIINYETNETYTINTIISDLELIVNELPLVEFNNVTQWGIVKYQQQAFKFFEISFKFPCGIFSIDDYLKGNWEIILSPYKNSSYKKFAIDSLINKEITDFNFNVIDLKYYKWHGEIDVMNIKKQLHFTKMRCQSNNINNNALLQKNFVVDELTYKISIAFQYGNPGFNSSRSITKFKAPNDYQNDLERYQINLGYDNLPEIYSDIIIDELNEINYQTRDYMYNLNETGSIYLNNPSNITEWAHLGRFYTHNIFKPPKNITVTTKFKNVFAENFQLLLFSFIKKTLNYEIKNGILINCDIN
jgi:hypothetical protein